MHALGMVCTQVSNCCFSAVCLIISPSCCSPSFSRLNVSFIREGLFFSTSKETFASHVGLAVATRPFAAVIGLLIKEVVGVIKRFFHSAAVVSLNCRLDPELFPVVVFLIVAPSLHSEAQVRPERRSLCEWLAAKREQHRLIPWN